MLTKDELFVLIIKVHDTLKHTSKIPILHHELTRFLRHLTKEWLRL